MDLVNYTIVIGFIYTLGEVLPPYDKFTGKKDQINTISRTINSNKPKRIIKQKDVRVVVIPHTRNGIQCSQL